MSSISLWKDQILFFWDGELPSGCSYPLAHVKERPDLLKPFWPIAGPYMHWSKLKRFFMLNLSAQNMQRLRAQFGELPIKGGKDLLEPLRDEYRQMQTMVARMIKIKEGSLEDIRYKIPPLAPYQHVGTNILTFCERVPLFADCGVGKTFMSLVSTQEQFYRGIVSPGKVLVCGKLMTLESGWLADCKKFTDMKAQLLWLPQTTKRREKLLKLLNEPADIYIINHDGIRVLEDELAAKQFDKVIVDESTILKSYYGERFQHGQFAKALLNVARHARWRVIMTGTPAPNDAQDLWGQFHFLDPRGLLLEASIHDFRHRWMKEICFGKANQPGVPRTWVMRPNASTEINQVIEPSMYRVKIRDHLHELPPETIISRKIPLGESQRKTYEEIDEALFTEVNGKEIDVNVILAKLTKLRQITGGFIIDNEEDPQPLADNVKIEELDSLLEEEIDPEHKVVIYGQYRWEIELLRSRYKRMGAVTVYGGNSSTENIANLKQFIEVPKVRLCILHPRSAAHGITLTCAHYMIFYSMSFSAEDDYQCIARIKRASQKHPMFIYYLLGEKTIDDTMYSVVERKRAQQSRLIDDPGNETDLDFASEVVNLWLQSRREKCSPRKRK